MVRDGICQDNDGMGPKFSVTGRMNSPVIFFVLGGKKTSGKPGEKGV